jgi:carbohydrate-selective porin OprB
MSCLLQKNCSRFAGSGNSVIQEPVFFLSKSDTLNPGYFNSSVQGDENFSNHNISLAVADADADWSDLFNDLFSIAEVNFKPEIAGHPGNYRVYGWFNGSDHEDLLDPTDTDENNYGVGLSFDQEITEILGIFARYGWQRGSVSQVEHAWSAGFQCSGKFYGRENDTFGLAYGMAVIGDDWKDANSRVNAGDEHHVELYYNIKVNDHLNISPDIQWVNNPNGDRDNDDVWAFGIRAQLSF